jgi:hypothetical protein
MPRKAANSLGEAFKRQQPVVMRTPRSKSHDADIFMKHGDAQAVLDIMVKIGMIRITYYDEITCSTLG